MSNDELIITEEDRKVGITRIKREGNLKKGFVIQFEINESTFNLPTGDNLRTIYRDLFKKINEFVQTNRIICNAETLRIRIEQILLKKVEWISGADIKNEREGYTTVNSESAHTSEDDSDDSDDDDRLTYTPVTVAQALRKHSGKIQIECIISSMEEKVSSLVKEANWKCRGCGNMISKEVFSFLEIPDPPKECGNCSVKLGFDNYHEYINSLLVKVHAVNSVSNASLEFLPVYLLNEHT